jgi:hypothetical protein
LEHGYDRRRNDCTRHLLATSTSHMKDVEVILLGRLQWQ